MNTAHHTAILLAFSIMFSAFFVYSHHQVGSKLAAAVISSQSKTTSIENETKPTVTTAQTKELKFTDFSTIGSPDPSTTTEVVSDDESKINTIPSISTPNPTEVKNDTDSLVSILINQSNAARQNYDLASLQVSNELASYAERRSVEMAHNYNLSHTSPDGCDLTCHWNRSGVATLTWGENLAEFTPYSSSLDSVIAETLITRWLESSGHRKNLLSDTFTHFGIGTTLNNDRLVVTVIFANL